MKIIRAEFNDTDIFSESELYFGACCFCTEDRACKYFFEINGQEATLHSNTERYVKQAMDEFLFYSGFITSIKDKDGHILTTRTPVKPYLLEISKLQPSQFYINKMKLERCKKWIKCPEDIFIPIAIKNGKHISLDGHTRLRAAADLGYTSVYVYPDEHDEVTFLFADEAIKRGILDVYDMELVDNEEYKLKWDKFCDEFFESLGE